eukprot:3448674-Prymnesium_polylepis.1
MVAAPITLLIACGLMPSRSSAATLSPAPSAAATADCCACFASFFRLLGLTTNGAVSMPWAFSCLP